MLRSEFFQNNKTSGSMNIPEPCQNLVMHYDESPHIKSDQKTAA